MIQFALIGLGAWGKNYISTIDSFTDCRIKYVCSKTPQILQSLKGNYVKTTDYRELFTYSDIDGVIIATPALTHFQITKDFLNHGYNVLVEKPLTTNLEEGKTLQRISQKKKKILMVGYIYLYNPAFAKLLRIIKKIGKVRYIQTEGFDWTPSRKDISVLWDWGSHDISMCLQIMQQFPKKIHASAYGINKNVGTVSLALYFKEAQAIINFGCILPKKKREVFVIGEKGSIIFDDTAEKKLIFFQNRGLAYSNDNLEARKTYPSYGNISPLAAEIRAFRDAIKGRKLPMSDIQYALGVTKILTLSEQAIYKNTFYNKAHSD